MIIKIQDNLYLGDHLSPLESSFGAILAMLNDPIPYVVPDSYYLRIPAPDGKGFTLEMCSEGVDFLHQHYLLNGRKTLVHCWSGVSRSVCTLSAYLAKHQGHNFTETVKRMLEARTLLKKDEKHLPDEHVLETCRLFVESTYKIG